MTTTKKRKELSPSERAAAKKFEQRWRLLTLVIGKDLKTHGAPRELAESLAAKLRDLYHYEARQEIGLREGREALDRIDPEFAELYAEIGAPVL